MCEIGVPIDRAPQNLFTFIWILKQSNIRFVNLHFEYHYLIDRTSKIQIWVIQKMEKKSFQLWVRSQRNKAKVMNSE